jgi:hypothetical protein
MATKKCIYVAVLQSTFGVTRRSALAALAQFYFAEQADTTSHLHSAR